MELGASSPVPLPAIAPFREAEVVSSSDPTDNALAAIASIREQPEPGREPEADAAEEKPAAPEPIEAHGYSKTGPGPMAAIRFKWAVRREENGDYYVDETIGENSAPVVSGPLTKDAAIALVDERENEARRRFEQLKSEMTGRAAAANVVEKDDSEI
jgi:hypothetical protein